MEVAMRYVITGILGLVLGISTLAAQTSSTPLDARDNNTSSIHPMHHDAARLSRAIGVVLDSTASGIIITNVFVSMPAFEAGICRGDVLLSINKQPVTSLQQAVQQTQRVSVDVVMLDVQRRDMRICRRVDVRDGRAQHIGAYKDGRTLALAISRFADGTSDELLDLTKRFTPSDLDTVILDMRATAGGSRYEAQKIARMLSGSQNRGGSEFKVIILHEGTSPSAVHALSDMLIQQRDAEIWKADLSDMDTAPVHWNMADFRERYPEPSPTAMQHPLLMAHNNAAPIAWGINGNAWAAMERVRGTRY